MSHVRVSGPVLAPLPSSQLLASVCTAQFPYVSYDVVRVPVNPSVVKYMAQEKVSSESTFNAVPLPSMLLSAATKRKKKSGSDDCEASNLAKDISDAEVSDDRIMESLRCHAPKWAAMIEYLNSTPLRNTLIYLAGGGFHQIQLRNLLAKVLQRLLRPAVVPFGQQANHDTDRVLSMGCPGTVERSKNDARYASFSKLCQKGDRGHVLILTGEDYQSRDFKGVTQLLLFSHESRGILKQLVGRAARWCSQASFTAPWITNVVTFEYEVSEEDTTSVFNCNKTKKNILEMQEKLENDVMKVLRSASWGCRVYNALSKDNNLDTVECAQYPASSLKAMAKLSDLTDTDAFVRDAQELNMPFAGIVHVRRRLNQKTGILPPVKKPPPQQPQQRRSYCTPPDIDFSVIPWKNAAGGTRAIPQLSQNRDPTLSDKQIYYCMRRDIDPIKAGKEKTSFPETSLLEIAKIINDKTTVKEVHAALLKTEENPNEKTLSFAVRSVLRHYEPDAKLDRELRYRIASDLNKFIQLYNGRETRSTILERYNTWRSATE